MLTCDVVNVFNSLRKFTTPCIHGTKRRAQQRVAFEAYVQLYQAGLLNNHLLPLSSAIEPDKKEEVEAMLAEVAKRAATAQVTVQMDPWAVAEDEPVWYAHELTIDGLPTLQLLTRGQLPKFAPEDFPTLYIPGRGEVSMTIRAARSPFASADEVQRARRWSYGLFYRLYGSRMERDNDDFCYLFLPVGEWPEAVVWETRRRWQERRLSRGEAQQGETPFMANAAAVGRTFSYPRELAMVRGISKFDKPLRLVEWRYQPLTMEEEEEFRATYEAYPDMQITYPLMVVKPFPRRRNFLIPFNEKNDKQKHVPSSDDTQILHPRHTLVELASGDEVHYTLLLPSILRWLSMALTVHSLRVGLFRKSPVAAVPLSYLATAITAPASQERVHYQRLETLGDTVLKFITSNQLYAEFPLWHEGYLSRKKDHMVANVSLAKEAVRKSLYKWIIRDRFVPRKWKPQYASPPNSSSSDAVEEAVMADSDEKDKKKAAEELSTKMLADVVESLIGAAYEHGGFDMAIHCVETFELGLSWQKLPPRIQAMHKVEDLDDIPDQLTLVEQMINYRFSRRTFLVQALTHASYQGDSAAMSLERLEFLGDSALDMIVVDYLYHAPGKNYTPGYMHIKKEAVVNSHILAYTCLKTSIAVQSAMPTWSPAQGLTMVDDTQQIHLWQCLLHSSHRVLEDQNLTFLRYQKRGAAIEHALAHDAVYPWAALTSLQAPKFISDMVESILGAVYIDSFGSLDAVRDVMRALGLMGILERVVHDDVDVLHPVSRLEIWAAKQVPQKKVDYVLEKAHGKVSCVVLVDGTELVKVTASYRSKVSEDEVRFTAAERANAKVNATDGSVDDIDADAEIGATEDEEDEEDAEEGL